MELTAGQLPELRDALLIDIRSGEERAYGVIEGALAASPEELIEIASRERGRKLVLICARMRRGYLYSFARELGCNKIALGHHFDDVIETILMGMLHGGQIQTMMPKLHSTNYAGMELIRALKKTNPHVEQLIFHSVENVNVDTVLAYKKNGVRHSFLDEYDSE